MTSRESELERFKTDIDLVAVAESRGFEVDRKKTSRASVAMRHSSSGERILVRKNANGHFVYASVHDPADNGTVIDFLQRRDGGTLGDIRKTLRPMIGVAAAPVSGTKRPSERQSVPLEVQTTDFEGVQSAFQAMSPITAPNGYLEERGIPASIYLHSRFEGRIRVDARRNVVFPHWRPGQLTGFEIKNRGFTGFAKGGRKTLWSSRAASGDKRLVLCETAIDALSYGVLFGVEDSRFVSTGGALNPQQPELIHAAALALPSGSEVVLAVDADTGGDELAERVEAFFLGHQSPPLLRHSPSIRNQDWNEVLRAGSANGQAPLP